ncbi:MAG: DUF362 domain-containing protein, partial [candidate division Zixibacteria bacterium]|nr:DUF362 domain-containing protein [candidate division Zixibacteria bacterium]
MNPPSPSASGTATPFILRPCQLPAILLHAFLARGSIMRRREFITRTGRALAVAAVTGGTGLFFHDREKKVGEELVWRARDFAVPPDSKFPVVAMSRNKDHLTALRRALDAVGGIGRFVQRGEKVTIKPNIGWDRAPEQAADTNPILVGEMVRQCLAAGAREVVVTDVSCNDPRRCFLRSGIKAAAEEAGALVPLPNENDFVRADLSGRLLTVWPVLKHFLETDRLINMPITKQHSLTSCTIGMKNLYGILGG